MKKLEAILVATDLTAASDQVLRAAAALAALADAKLHVLHAFDFPFDPYTEKTLARASFPDRMRDAERAMDEQVRRAARPGVDVASREVVIYEAYKAILNRAAAVGADLVVLGPHRRRALGDAFLGGTADRVIRTADVPCLVVQGPLSLPLRRVVVPLDLSEPALAALDIALGWSHALRPHEDDPRPGRELIVLHVIPRVFDFEDLPFDRAAIAPELEREIQAARARIAGAEPVEVRKEVRSGDSPVEEILRLAAEETVDLVVLATHGHGAIKRALIGSVASGVARRAKCPVLLVPPALWKE
jgi:universal stress protein E